MEFVEKVVRVFDSFEEADAADAISRAQMTPQQRVGIFFELRELFRGTDFPSTPQTSIS